jgi:hypothetical protein
MEEILAEDIGVVVVDRRVDELGENLAPVAGVWGGKNPSNRVFRRFFISALQQQLDPLAFLSRESLDSSLGGEEIDEFGQITCRQ